MVFPLHNGDNEWEAYDYNIYDEQQWDNVEDEWAWADTVWDDNTNGEGPSDPTAQRALTARMQRAIAGHCIVNIHNEFYMNKVPCRTSALGGSDWMAELRVGHPKRLYQSFRMSRANFYALCELLEQTYGLEGGGGRVSVEEKLAIFLYIVGQNANTRNAQERFQHSGETIHRHFHSVLQSLKAMATQWVRPHPWPRTTIHPKILHSERYSPAFQDAIGPIDGTHIKVHPPLGDEGKWIGRKGYPTQNIMAVTDFSMCFTFVLAGWEGSAHDTRIFYQTIRNHRQKGFPSPTGDEYYLIDAGYPNIPGYLAPFKGVTYHMFQWRAGARAGNGYEKFNKLHSSLRCTIERTFGVWKERWPMICDMPPGYSFQTQKDLVITTMTVHNFIRRRNMPDIPFGFYDRHEGFLLSDRGVDTTVPNSNHGETVERDSQNMDMVRDGIRDYIIQNNIRVN